MSVTGEIKNEVQHRAWQSALSLIRSLGSSLDVSQVTKLSLLTVTGQLLVRKAAFYLAEPGEQNFRICALNGLRSSKVPHPLIRIPDALHAELSSKQPGWVTSLDPRCGIESALLAHFQYATYLSDGHKTVGLLMLGDKLGGRAYDKVDQALLSTMGLVVGTTLKKAIAYEEVVKANTRLEEAEELRQQIVDHVSHEFNTPLVVIKSTADMVRTATDEQREELFEMLDESVERLERLVKAIMSVTSHGAGAKPVLQSVSHADLIEASLIPVVNRWREKGVRALSCHRPDRLLQAEVDLGMVGAIIDQLIDNASYFQRDENNWIAIHSYIASRPWWRAQDNLARLSEYERLLAEDSGDELPRSLLPDTSTMFVEGNHLDEPALFIEVIDGGVGVPTKDQRAIFEPFRQASNSPNLGVRGAGMGLSNAKKLAESMNGQIFVASQEGQGSMFVLCLPAHLT